MTEDIETPSPTPEPPPEPPPPPAPEGTPAEPNLAEDPEATLRDVFDKAAAPRPPE